MDSDECKKAASASGLMRLSHRDEYKPIHILQRWFMTRHILLAISEFFGPVAYLLINLIHIKIMIQFQQWHYVFIGIIAFLWECCVFYCLVLLPLSDISILIPFVIIRRCFSCPATHSYHLEHILFPHINYTYLPRIAPIVEATCEEFGLPYNKICGFMDLNRKINAHLNDCGIRKTKKIG